MIDKEKMEMILWLDKFSRSAPRVEPLVRIGYLKGKDYCIARQFDHIAFSYRPLETTRLLIEDQHGRKEIDYPHCMISLPGETRSITPLEPFDEFFLVFAGSSLEQLFNGLKPNIPKFNNMPLSECPLAASYVSMMMKLLDGAMTAQVCSQLDMLGWNLLACTFWRNAEERNSREDRLADIENYINHHFCAELDLENLARKFGMSYPTFRRLWAQKHKDSPYATILSLRNREAQELLRTNNLSIGKIAELVGFKDVRYFSRFFHSANGMTASEFRTSLQKQ